MEARKAYTESDLEKGVLYDVIYDKNQKRVLLYWGEIYNYHSFLSTTNVPRENPIENLKGKIRFGPDGKIRLEIKEITIYQRSEKGYAEKSALFKKAYAKE